MVSKDKQELQEILTRKGIGRCKRHRHKPITGTHRGAVAVIAQMVPMVEKAEAKVQFAAGSSMEGGVIEEVKSDKRPAAVFVDPRKG